MGAAAVNVQTKSGADTIGTYTEIAFDFQRDVTRHAAIRSYWDRAAVRFTVSQSAASANTFAFPNLSEYPKNLSHLPFSGTFAPPSFSNLANESPWAYFDSSANTSILSAASNFMTSANTRAASGELGAGIASQIASLSAGFQHQTLL